VRLFPRAAARSASPGWAASASCLPADVTYFELRSAAAATENRTAAALGTAADLELGSAAAASRAAPEGRTTTSLESGAAPHLELGPAAAGKGAAAKSWISWACAPAIIDRGVAAGLRIEAVADAIIAERSPASLPLADIAASARTFAPVTACLAGLLLATTDGAGKSLGRATATRFAAANSLGRAAATRFAAALFPSYTSAWRTTLPPIPVGALAAVATQAFAPGTFAVALVTDTGTSSAARSALAAIAGLTLRFPLIGRFAVALLIAHASTGAAFSFVVAAGLGGLGVSFLLLTTVALAAQGRTRTTLPAVPGGLITFASAGGMVAGLLAPAGGMVAGLLPLAGGMVAAVGREALAQGALGAVVKATAGGLDEALAETTAMPVQLMPFKVAVESAQCPKQAMGGVSLPNPLVEQILKLVDGH
jgi:hypothetical protein